MNLNGPASGGFTMVETVPFEKRRRKERRGMSLWLGLPLLFLAGIVFVPPVSGQAGRGTARLSGIVTDQEGAPIPGARITLRLLFKAEVRKNASVRILPEDSAVFYASTDKKGRWSCQGLGTGRWKVSVAADDFSSADIECDVLQLTANPRIVLDLVRNAGSPETDPAEADWLTQANDAFARKEYAAALELYRRYRERQPAFDMVSLSIGDSLKGMGEWDQAIAEFQAVVDKTSENPVDAYLTGLAYVGIAECHWARKEMPEAEAYFRRALAASSLNALWAYNLAELLTARGAAAEAAAAYGEAVRIDPTWSEPLYKAGLAYLRIGEANKAAASFRAFLKIEPRSARATEVRDMLEDLGRK